jgi:recombinational DNA repair ATPase RecF
MITTITLKNFKSHKHTVLNLDESRLHAIVGQNSSGKTSVLQAIYYLSQLATRRALEIFQADHSPEYLASSGEKSSEVIAQGWWQDTDQYAWSASLLWQINGQGKWQPRCS